MLYLYAFIRGLGVLPRVAGLEERPLELFPVGHLDAVLSRHDELEQEPAAEALAAHAAVVDALMEESTDVVPVRFGSAFSDEDALRSAAAARMPALEQVLQRVRNRVEFGLHVVRQTPHRPSAETQTGRTRLLAKLEQVRSADRAAELDKPLAELAVDSRRRLLRSPRLLLSGSYLVERSRASEFAERAGSIVRHRPRGLEVLATGPWPPYSFAELEDDLHGA